MISENEDYCPKYVRPTDDIIEKLFSPVIEEFKNGNFSITEGKRKEELQELLKINPHVVPIEFTNLVVKQLIEKKGTHFPMKLVNQVVLSLGYSVLKESDKYCSIQIKHGMNCWGTSDENGISINSNLVQNLKFGSRNAIVTLFHEINHRFQPEFVESKKFCYKAYELQQDEIMMEANRYYYDKNYDHICAEIDSNLRSELLFYRYLKEISPESAKSLKKEIYNECERQLKNRTQKRKLGIVVSTREELVDDLIAKQPSLLKEYPIFQLFYKRNGEKVLLSKVLLDYKKIHDRKQQLEKTSSPSELESDATYQELLSQLGFYRQVLRYRTGSYRNTKKDYLSIMGSDIEFLDSCANDSWLEEEREKILVQYEKKYLYLSLIRENMNFMEQSEIVEELLQKLQSIEIMPSRLNILKRTVASIQYLKDSVIKERLMQNFFRSKDLEENMETAYRK